MKKTTTKKQNKTHPISLGPEAFRIELWVDCMCFHPHEWSLCFPYFVKTQKNRFQSWKFFMWQLSEMYYNSKEEKLQQHFCFTSFFSLLLCHAARACTTGVEFSDYIIDILKVEFHLHKYSLW